MPALMIHIADGQWIAAIENTEQFYVFSGATLEAQAANVESLANQMIENSWAQLSEIFATDLEAYDLNQLLFGTTQSIIYNGTEAYAAADEEFLISCLDQAGQGLLGLL